MPVADVPHNDDGNGDAHTAFAFLGPPADVPDISSEMVFRRRRDPLLDADILPDTEPLAWDLQSPTFNKRLRLSLTGIATRTMWASSDPQLTSYVLAVYVLVVADAAADDGAPVATAMSFPTFLRLQDTTDNLREGGYSRPRGMTRSSTQYAADLFH